ncbi:MAG: transposase [Sphingomicrobium sp.]
MARLARVVIPDIPHHVTQRGNRRQPVFFSDDDRREYLRLVSAAARAAGVRCLAWCLMDNHVHLILVPPRGDSLRATLAEAHRRYSRMVNMREGWLGYLFQGRFASYPMDEAHLMAAVRYIERNPVAAGMVAKAGDWPWSSARSHIAGRRVAGDPLTDVGALAGVAGDWRAMLEHGWEAADGGGSAAATVDAAIEARLRTGRPLGPERWMAAMEQRMGRRLRPEKRGRKPLIRGHYT